jgi:non-homologous end joining protein Ku
MGSARTRFPVALNTALAGRLTLSRRERMVVVEPRGTGMARFTLRAAEEVRAAQFGSGWKFARLRAQSTHERN